MTGWLFFRPTPLKNDGVKVSWDDDIPSIWENKFHVPNHQPDDVSICKPPFIVDCPCLRTPMPVFLNEGDAK